MSVPRARVHVRGMLIEWEFLGLSFKADVTVDSRGIATVHDLVAYNEWGTEYTQDIEGHLDSEYWAKVKAVRRWRGRSAGRSR
jgi:hypothetical protein